MIIKKYTQNAVIFNYFFAEGDERKIYRKANNVFYEADALYSYGMHFPLAVKCRNGYVLNGDKYSSSTSYHQNNTRYVAELHRFVKTHGFMRKQIYDAIKAKKDPYYAMREIVWQHRIKGKKECPICRKVEETHHEPTHHAIIPFSSLRGAGIKPEDITLLDIMSDFYTTVKVKNSRTGKIEEKHIHHLGASLFRVGRKVYLSSIDTGSRTRGWGASMPFYLVRLRSNRGVRTVEQAYRELAANLTYDQYMSYQVWSSEKELFASPYYVKRQGEYFLVPHPDLETKDLIENAKNFVIRKENPQIHWVVEKTSEIDENIRKMLSKGKIKYSSIHPIKYRGKDYLVKTYLPMNFYPEDFELKPDGGGNFKFYDIQRGPIHHRYDLSNGHGNAHVARDAVFTKDGKIFIRGTLRHREHKMIRMGDVWHEVIKNTALDSWSAEGNVD